MQPIQMDLSQKQKAFFWIFLCIIEIYIKIWTFEKKNDPHRWCISDMSNSVKRVEIYIWKVSF